MSIREKMNIPDLCTILKLTYVRDNYEQLIKEARQTSQDPAEFLSAFFCHTCERL